MRALRAVVLLIVTAAAPLRSQVAGDSIRLRIPPAATWRHGRVVSVDSVLRVSHATVEQAYSFQAIGRADVRTRKNPVLTILACTVGALAGTGLWILTRPANRESVFGSDGAALAVSAGIGLTVGAIEIAVSPWYWKRTKLRVKAAT